MKKMLLTTSTVCIILIILSKVSSLTAYATNNTLDVVVKCITSDEASYYNSHMTPSSVQCAAGDYAVSLVISDNTGFAATGYRIKYNTSFGTPRTYMSGTTVRPIYCKGTVFNDTPLTVIPSVNLSSGILGYATIGGTNEIDSGVILTFFIQPIQQLTVSQEQGLITEHGIDKWLDYQTNAVQTHVTNGYTLYSYSSGTPYTTWIIGDIDHDGYITAADAQWIYILYTDYTVTGDQIIYTAEYIGTYIIDLSPSSPVTVDAIYVATVCDVNEDGVIDVEDAMDVLTYYTTYVTGQGNLNDYTGIIGTSTGLYTEYSVTFS